MLVQYHAVAEIAGLMKVGRGLAVWLVIAAVAFLVTRRGRAGLRNTPQWKLFGARYVVMLYMRWIFLAMGCVGLLLLIVGVVL
ncbi:MAG: hypothetical protein ACYDEY_10160 [Acidimicrobiales bacterium]